MTFRNWHKIKVLKRVYPFVATGTVKVEPGLIGPLEEGKQYDVLLPFHKHDKGPVRSTINGGPTIVYDITSLGINSVTHFPVCCYRGYL